MNTIDLTEIHKIELAMLKAVTDLCDRYSLRYSIYCGTLLGAVRHKGFIPWDDDIDLAMPLADYRKFMEHAEELPSPFTVVHRDNTRNYGALWLKVLANGTTFMNINFAEVDTHHGLFLDIYPMIGTPKLRFLRKMQSALLFLASKLQVAVYYPFLEKPGCIRLILAHIPFGIRKVIIDFILWLCLIDPGHSEYIGTIDAAPFEGKYKREDWKEMIKLPFEDAYYTAPARYDKILRRMYWDYMKLPPEDKQTGHVKENMIVDMHRDYRLYRKELLGK